MGRRREGGSDGGGRKGEKDEGGRERATTILQLLLVPIAVAAVPIFKHPSHSRVRREIFYGIRLACTIHHRQKAVQRVPVNQN